MRENLTLEQMKANRKLWVEALRSGKYEQGQGQLRDKQAFCCLGVACDVLGYEWDGDDPVGWGSPRRGLMPRPAAIQMGLSLVPEREGWHWLAMENDNGRSFSEIADIIESEPEGLFVSEVQP